jgi:pimeloyl-ACP methyl ester carboxylesterase
VLGGFDKTTLAEDIHRLIETLDLGPVHLVGFDWGAVIAYFCAARHHAQVRSLTLLEGIVPGFGFEQALDMRDSTATWFVAFHAQPDLPEALITGRERLYLQSLFQSFLYDPTVVSDADLDEYARTHARPGALRAALGMYRTMPEDISAARDLARTPLRMRVLALGGAESFGAAVADAARPLAPHLQGGVTEQAAHFLAEERPEEVARRLLDFFLAADSTSDGLG